jgi:DNA primase catalytic subunit
VSTIERRTWHFSGRCGGHGWYDLDVVTFGDLTSKHLRNFIRQIEIQAEFLAEDEAREVTNHAAE